jgi:predicted PurR-regulated permease PerM
MSDPVLDSEAFRRRFLLLLTLAITAVFVTMVSRFLTTLLLAAILSGMSHPLYRWIRHRTGDRPNLASALTVVTVFVVIIGPLLGFLTVVAAEAVQLSKTVGPWVQERMRDPGRLEGLINKIPFAAQLQPHADEIISRLGTAAGRLGTLVVNSLADVARGTATFVFQLFLMLYAMFFFLIDGRAALNKILYYMPLGPQDEERMVEKFVSVTRATIKGTVVIGILQGGLAGLGFWVADIQAPVFWATVMAVLSILPAVGTVLIWLPAVALLLVSGRTMAAVLLFVWCAGVVGSIDNFLRPRLVGKDTKLPELLILLATIGGIIPFGAAGVIIGPIVAALLVTVWDIYGTAFKDILPPVPEGVAPEKPDSKA